MKESIRLRELEEGDEQLIFQMLSKERVVRYTLFPQFTKIRSQEYVRGVIKSRDEKPRRNLVLAIIGDNQLIGICGLVLKPENEEAEAWYVLDEPHWGQGYATESAQQLIGIGFGNYSLHRIWATCVPENLASARVLEKVGMRKEGYLKENLRIQGIWRDTFLYAILHSEWVSLSKTEWVRT
jgi:RimJ/RimL family protein N-acetyltransferase